MQENTADRQQGRGGGGGQTKIEKQFRPQTCVLLSEESMGKGGSLTERKYPQKLKATKGSQ